MYCFYDKLYYALKRTCSREITTKIRIVPETTNTRPALLFNSNRYDIFCHLLLHWQHMGMIETNYTERSRIPASVKSSYQQRNTSLNQICKKYCRPRIHCWIIICDFVMPLIVLWYKYGERLNRNLPEGGTCCSTTVSFFLLFLSNWTSRSAAWSYL